MKKKSKVIILSLTLCAIFAVGATFAYFFASTDAKTNTFTMSNGISIQLAEPNYDNLQYDGVTSAGIEEAKLGSILSKNFVPGRVIPKDPSVKNVSGLEDVWIAVKLDYRVGAADTNPAAALDPSDTYAELEKFAVIDFDSTNWESNSDYTIFYFKTKVPPESTATTKNYTTELFSQIKIKDTLTEVGAAYYPFNINVTAYAVQAEGVEYETAKTQLAGFINPTP